MKISRAPTVGRHHSPQGWMDHSIATSSATLAPLVTSKFRAFQGTAVAARHTYNVPTTTDSRKPADASGTSAAGHRRPAAAVELFAKVQGLRVAVEHTFMRREHSCFLGQGGSRQKLYLCRGRWLDADKKNVGCEAFVRATLSKAKEWKVSSLHLNLRWRLENFHYFALFNVARTKALHATFFFSTSILRSSQK